MIFPKKVESIPLSANLNETLSAPGLTIRCTFKKKIIISIQTKILENSLEHLNLFDTIQIEITLLKL